MVGPMRPPPLPSRALTLALIALALLLASVGHVQLEHDVAHWGGEHACEHTTSGQADGQHLCCHGHEAHDCLLCLLTGTAPPEEEGLGTSVRAARALVARLWSAAVAGERRPETERGPPELG
jgi:hypothetical protein